VCGVGGAGTRGARGLDIGTSLDWMNGLAEPDGEGDCYARVSIGSTMARRKAWIVGST
jgi:hypothetical protein